jgi:hypothetical protein
MLVLWTLALAYLIVFIATPYMKFKVETFGTRVSEALAFSNQHPASEPVVHADISHDHTPVASNYSSYDGFKSFAQNGTLSIDDIVQGLARQHTVPSALIAPHTEPIYDRVEPVYENVEPIVPEPGQRESHLVSTRGFLSSIVNAQRDMTFAMLRDHVQSGGKAEALLTTTVLLLDDAYRARIDGTPCAPDVVELVRPLTTATLERLINALSTAVDSSYSHGVTGAKLALTRALTVLSA